MHARTRTRCLTLLLITATLGSLAGCSEEPAAPDRSRLPIMPLAVGNMWIGKSYGLDSLGGPTGVERDTLTIVASETIAGETWYRTSRGLLLAGRADGLWARASADEPARQIAKHPASVGEIFGRDTVAAVYHDTLGNSVDTAVVDARIVVAVGTSTTVAAGTYSVTGYEERVSSLADVPVEDAGGLWKGDQEYYAPGVGRVKALDVVMTPRGPGVWRAWELVEARLK